MPGVLALLFCALVGFILAYFLNAYIVLILAVVAIVALFFILKGPHQAEGGLAALFLASFVASFLVGLIIGCLPFVPWGDLWEYISQLKIKEFFKDYILR